ncbi:MAG: 4Fe-4S binding protein [Candidatus Helarchaeota archaeon]
MFLLILTWDVVPLAFLLLLACLTAAFMHVFHTHVRTKGFASFHGFIGILTFANHFIQGKWSWFFRSRIKRFIFEEMRLLMLSFRAVSLEPYTVEETKAIVKNLFRNHKNLSIIARICPCRAATNTILDKNGNPFDDKPVVTDLVFLTKTNSLPKSNGAKGFMKFISIDEALEKIDIFEKAGLVHTFLGPCDAIYGSVMLTICNCNPNVCLPLLWHKRKNFSFYRKSHNIAVVDVDKCTGCGNCIKRCPINARALSDGKPIVLDHCFGCGTCRVTCEGQATRIVPTKHKPTYFPEYMVRRSNGDFIGN